MKTSDSNFRKRVYETPQKVYEDRLKAISFSGLGSVCDAGCGYGQWSLALASLNESVYGIDVSKERIENCQSLTDEIIFSVSDTQSTDFLDDTFDGIFSYSVIYFADYRKTLKEFHRILKPGGRLYVGSNDVGWYIHLITDEPFKCERYDPKELALAAIQRSICYFNDADSVDTEASSDWSDEDPEMIIMPIDILTQDLRKLGFKIIASGPDGTIDLDGTNNPKSFFKESYHGKLGPYEVLAEKL